MAAWPPILLYGAIALSVAVENFFPPSPSDVLVVLAAFLARQGGLDPAAIFLVAWGFSVAGAAAVYGVARRYGRAFFESPAGRRLLSPDAYAAVEREYLRFGVAGMFFFRLLPGFRAFVAPFSGLARLGALRAMLPMALASGLWFAGLVWLGTAVGSQWTGIEGLLGRLNRTLAIVAAVVLLGSALLVRRRIRARRQARIEQLAQEDRASGRGTPP